MDNFNKVFPSSTSVKPYSVANPSYKDAGGNKSNNENEWNPEMASKIRSPSKKQLPTKNFMNPTISAAIKAAVPKNKVLGERNETLDTFEQTSLLRSSSFGSKGVKSPVVDANDDVETDFVGKPCLQPYDPIKNYLSPRPKFLRYNPNRRRKILNLQENDVDCVKISTYFDAGNDTGSSGLEVGLGSSGSTDPCSQKESAEETEDVNNEEREHENGEECEGEDDEENMFEFGDDRCCCLKGFLKILFVVIALILTTQVICSMNGPTPSQTLESVWGFRDPYNVFGLNFSEVGYGQIREPDLMVGRWKEEDVYDDYERLYMIGTTEEFVEVQNAQIDYGVYQDEVQEDETDVIQDEILLEHDIAAIELIEIENTEAEKVHDFNQHGLIEEDDSDANEKNSQLTTDAEFKIANDMEVEMEKEIDDIKTNDVLIKLASYKTIAVLIGFHILILIFFNRSKCKKSSVPVTTPVEKEEFKDIEPTTNPPSLIQQKEEERFVTSASLVVPPLQNHVSKEPFVNSDSLAVPPLQNDVSKEISHIYAPSVELLGEFVFGEEIASSVRSYNISAVNDASNSVSFSQTKSSHMEMSTGDSDTVKKQRRKNAEVVTPSSVRRSSRLKTRSVMSP